MAEKEFTDPEDLLAIKDLMEEQLVVMRAQKEKANEINAVFKDQADNLFGASDYQKEIVEQLIKAKDISAEEKIIQKSIVEIMTKKKYLSTDAKKTILEGLNNRMKELQLQKKQKEEEKVRIAEQKKAAAEEAAADAAALKRLEDFKKKSETASEELAKSLSDSTDGFIDSLEGKVKSIPFVGNFLSKAMGFDELRDEFKEKVAGAFTEHFKASMANQKGLSSSIMSGFQGMTSGVMGFGKSLLVALAPFAPLLITLAAIKLAFDFDKQVIELSRNLGISRKEAIIMRDTFNDMSLTSKELLYTTKDLLKAQEELTEHLGTSSMFSEDLLKSQVKLTKFWGLTGEKAAEFNVWAETIGENTEDVKTRIAGTVILLEKATDESINLNGVFKDISDLSEEIKASFKGSVEQMTAAVIMAKQMGTTLEKSSAAAQKTLSYTSSLKKELRAYLLTGVKINNNEIRAAILADDKTKVLELQKQQLRGIHDLEGKHVWQQKSIAEAMQMSLGEMLKMNQAVKFRDKYGKDITQATVEELMAHEGINLEQAAARVQENERLTLQQKMAVSMEKLSQSVQTMTPALIGIVDAFSSILSIFGLVAAAFAGLYEGFKMLSSMITSIAQPFIDMYDYLVKMEPIIGLIGSALKGVAYLGVISAAYTAFKALASGGGIPGAIAGAIFAAGIVSTGFGLISGIATPAGDLMSPADGKTQVSTKEGGLFELSPNDDVIAAPGLLSEGGIAAPRLLSEGGITAPGLLSEGGIVGEPPVSQNSGIGDLINEPTSQNSSIGGLINEPNDKGALAMGGGIDLSGLINEIKGLRSDIQTQPIQITVDGRVVSEISRVQRKQNSVRTTGYGR
jgi:hypothetical protein